MEKHYTQAPLPFVGQKRMFLKEFKDILNKNIEGNGDGWTIVDVFGGSGLLAHVAKRTKPSARVIYNDYDDYSERLRNIGDTERLREKLAFLVRELPKNYKLSVELKEKILNTIREFEGFRDWKTIASWLIFSGRAMEVDSGLAGLEKNSFYNCVKKSKYDCCDYLRGLEIVKESFLKLMPKFMHTSKTLFILDPPYLCTSQKFYNQEEYFDLIEFLKLIELTKPPFIFFSSTKSEFIRFLKWTVENKRDNWETFADVDILSKKATINKNSNYEDNLVFKF